MSPAERETAVIAAYRERKTVDEYGKHWIAQRDLKPRTVIHYTKILDTHISPTLGTIAVANLKPALIRNW